MSGKSTPLITKELSQNELHDLVAAILFNLPSSIPPDEYDCCPPGYYIEIIYRRKDENPVQGFVDVIRIGRNITDYYIILHGADPDSPLRKGTTLDNIVEYLNKCLFHTIILICPGVQVPINTLSVRYVNSEATIYQGSSTTSEVKVEVQDNQ